MLLSAMSFCITFFFDDTATTQIDTKSILGTLRCI